MAAKFRTAHLPFDDERKQLFLDALADEGLIRTACITAGVAQETIRLHRQDDETFKLACHAAKQAYLQTLRAAAKTRGVDGVITRREWDENGELIREVRTFSDLLLTKVMQRSDAEMRDSVKVDASVKSDVTQRTKHEVDLEGAMKQLSREGREHLRAVLGELGPDESADDAVSADGSADDG